MPFSRQIPFSLLLWSAFLVAAAIQPLGCAKNDSSSLGQSAESAEKWNLSVSSECQTLAREECVGSYGLSLSSRGTFRVGPGPAGELLTGTIPADSFAELSRAVEDVLPELSAPERAESCSPIPAASPESTAPRSVRLQLRSGALDRALLRSGASGWCTRILNAERSDALLKVVTPLLESLYPVPFPDSNCDGAAAELQALYVKLRGCSKDDDCSYVDSNLQPLPRTGLSFVLTGDCTGVKPMIVGNRERVLRESALALTLRSNAVAACKTRAARALCTGFSEFQATQPAPVCSAGICRANGSVTAAH